jgi:hypothetical protein
VNDSLSNEIEQARVVEENRAASLRHRTGPCYKAKGAMSFDPQKIFGNLAEKERLKGHHSPEGRAIRIMSRALNGWSSEILSGWGVLVLCEQAVEDWLKARLNIAAWSMRGLTSLTATGVEKKLITRLEAVRLQRIHKARSRARQGRSPAARDVEAALEFCIRLIEKHW